MKHPARAIVGAAVSFVILILYLGGVPDAAMFMALSIVCTAGVSLVVWLPVWYGLGWFVLSICGMAGAIPESKKPARIRTQYERDMDAVNDYVRHAQASGLSKGRIRVKLEEAGWNMTLIDEALKQLGQRTPGSQTHTG